MDEGGTTASHVDTGEIVQELKRYSDVIADMDTNMMRLRDKIKEI